MQSFTVHISFPSGARFIAYKNEVIPGQYSELGAMVADSIVAICNQIEAVSPSVSPENILKRAEIALFGTYGESVKL